MKRSLNPWERLTGSGLQRIPPQCKNCGCIGHTRCKLGVQDRRGFTGSESEALVRQRKAAEDRYQDRQKDSKTQQRLQNLVLISKLPTGKAVDGGPLSKTRNGPGGIHSTISGGSIEKAQLQVELANFNEFPRNVPNTLSIAIDIFNQHKRAALGLLSKHDHNHWCNRQPPLPSQAGWTSLSDLDIQELWANFKKAEHRQNVTEGDAILKPFIRDIGWTARDCQLAFGIGQLRFKRILTAPCSGSVGESTSSTKMNTHPTSEVVSVQLAYLKLFLELGMLYEITQQNADLATIRAIIAKIKIELDIPETIHIGMSESTVTTPLFVPNICTWISVNNIHKDYDIFASTSTSAVLPISRSTFLRHIKNNYSLSCSIKELIQRQIFRNGGVQRYPRSQTAPST